MVAAVAAAAFLNVPEPSSATALLLAVGSVQSKVV